MFFKKKIVYGLQAVLYLSRLDKNTILSAKEISDELDIPKEFVSKVLQELTKDGIIDSKKGKGGGFSLGKDPEDIVLIDIIRGLDSSLEMSMCLMGFKECSSDNECPLHTTFSKLKTEFKDMLVNYSLNDLQEYDLLSVKK